MSWAHKSISENVNEQNKLTTRQFHHAATRYEGKKAWEFNRKNVNKLARSLWKFCEFFLFLFYDNLSWGSDMEINITTIVDLIKIAKKIDWLQPTLQ